MATSKVYLQKTVISKGLYLDLLGTVKAVLNGDLKFSAFDKLGIKLSKSQKQNLKMSIDILRRTGHVTDNSIGCMLASIVTVK